MSAFLGHITFTFCSIIQTAYLVSLWAFQVVLVVKNSPASTGDIRDMVLIPGSVRFPGGGHDGLENPMHRGAWQAIVPRVTKSRT